MQYIVYRFGREIWLVPKDLVTTEFTSAYNTIIGTKAGQPEVLTTEQSEAFFRLLEDPTVVSINPQ